MPAYINDLRDEILTLVGSVWPEVKANGIYRSRDLGRVDFDQKAAAGLPLAVLDLDGIPSGDWGIANRADLFAVRIYYVCDDGTTQEGLLAKLELLRTLLWPDGNTNALSEGQVMEFPQISDSAESTVNRYFLMRQWPFWSGVVTAQVLAGTTP